MHTSTLQHILSTGSVVPSTLLYSTKMNILYIQSSVHRSTYTTASWRRPKGRDMRTANIGRLYITDTYYISISAHISICVRISVHTSVHISTSTQYLCTVNIILVAA